MLFALLLVPKNFYPVLDSLITVSLVLNPLLMSTLAALIIRDGLAVRGRAGVPEQIRRVGAAA